LGGWNLSKLFVKVEHSFSVEGGGHGRHADYTVAMSLNLEPVELVLIGFDQSILVVLHFTECVGLEVERPTTQIEY